jgi:endonuclease YncB( thermonuclease family)
MSAAGGGARRRRAGRLARALPLALMLAAGAGAALGQSGNAVVAGPASVIDASHLEIAGHRFKLYGIDAPDADEVCQSAQGKDYPCGIEARDALVSLIGSAAVSCTPRGPDQNNAMMAVCAAGERDLGRAMVEAGWAIADRTRTLVYEETELKARTAKRGIWQGPFVPPAAWRLGERVPQNRKGPGALQGIF